MSRDRTKAIELDVALLNDRYIVLDGCLHTRRSMRLVKSDQVLLNGVKLYTHRVLYILATKATIPAGLVIDHIDGNKTNNQISNLRAVTSTINNHNKVKQCNNASGINGVQRYMKRGHIYYIARWIEAERQCSKCFAVNTLGEEEALRLAIAYREAKVLELNNQGYGYTDRHGN